MSFLGLFGKGPLSEKKISKAAKLASNPFAQPDIRMREMQRLLDDGSEDAYRGVLKRFASNANGHIADEDEKKWLEDALVERGDAAVGPLQEYVGREQQLTYALRAYRRIQGDDAASEFFVEVLKRYGPDDYRSADAKLQLIWQLGDGLDSDSALQELCVFLDDHSDDVQWAVLDLIERAADEDRLSDTVRQRVCEQLSAMVLDDTAGPRMQRRALEIFVNRRWPVGGTAESLTPHLENEYFLDKKRFVRKRVKRS